MLIVEKVTRRFGAREALREISFAVHAGDGIALTGANGSGKTTLLRLSAGLLRPTRGTVRIAGEDPRRSPAVRARIGWLGHELGLYPELTVEENLRFFADLFPGERSSEKIRSALETVELSPRAETRVSDLSRGMKERLALARLLLHNPDLLLLDEPTTGLDEVSVGVLERLVRDWRARGAAIVLSTHDRSFVEKAGLTSVILA